MAYGLADQIDNLLKKRGSPMAGLGSVFVAAGKKYGVDPRLTVSISGQESSFGKYLFAPYNAWGWMSPRGKGGFNSWQDGITTVTKGLYDGYISQGLKTPATIGPKYAPAEAGNDVTAWTSGVSSFMRELGSAPSTTTSRVIVAPSTPPSSSANPVPLSKATTRSQAAVTQPSIVPSTAGIQQALIDNLLLSVGHRGRPSDMLQNILQGVTQDRLADQAAQATLPKTEPARQPSVVTRGTEENPTPRPPSAEKVPDKGPAQTEKPPDTQPGLPVPKPNLVRILGEHGTDGLPGFTGKDYVASAGDPAVAPVTGKVVKLSGHDPAEGPMDRGGAYAWSVYIQGVDGKIYYLTHMGSRTVAVGQTVQQGQTIGTVANWHQYWGTPDHIHMGVGSYVPS